jgi:hypothetical protein
MREIRLFIYPCRLILFVRPVSLAKSISTKEDHEQTYRRCTCNFPEEINKVAKLKPLDQHQVKMVHEAEDAHVQCIRRPAHAFAAGFYITLFGSVFRDQQVEKVGPDISDQHAGRGMEAGRGGR